MKKALITIGAICGIVVILIILASVSSPVGRTTVSSETAIYSYLDENFGRARTSWFDGINALAARGDTVIIGIRKPRRNDALEICEAVSSYIYSLNNPNRALQKIEVRASSKLLAQRSG